MTDTDSLEEILSKFAGNKIDSKEFLNLILTSDETGVDYLQNLKKEFKESYVNPVFKKVTDHYKKIDNVISDEESKKKVLSNIHDPMGVIGLNREYSEKARKILDKQLKDLNLNSVSEKEKQNTALNNSTVSAVVEPNSSVIDPNKFSNKFQEQELLTQKIPTISLTDETISKLGGVLGDTLGKIVKNFKNNDKKEEESGSSGLGLLLTLLGGTIAGIITYISDLIKSLKNFKDILISFNKNLLSKVDDLLLMSDRIKNFLKLDELAEWMKTKLGKVVDTIKDVGFYFKSYLDEFILNPFKEKWTSMMNEIKNFINVDEVADAAKAKQIASAEKTVKDLSMLDKIYDGIKSFGVKVLETGTDVTKNVFTKAESVINPIFDFIARGLNFLSDSVKPLYGIIDEIGKGLVGILKSAAGLPIIRNILTFASKLSVFLVVLDPLIAAGKTLFEVWNNENLNVFEKGLSVLTAAFFGLGDGIASLLGILSEGATGIGNLTTGKGWKTENTVGNFMRELTGGERDKNGNVTGGYDFGGMGANMGNRLAFELEDSTSDKVIDKNFDPTKTEKYKKLQELNIGGLTSDEEKYLDENYDNKGNFIKNKPAQVKRDDFSFKNLMTSTAGNSILYDKNTNTENILHPDDNVLTYKTDGVFDLALKELTLLAQSINKGIYKIPESLEKNKSNASNVSVVNGSGGSSNNNMLDVILSGTRPDSIYNFRRSIQGEFA